MAGGPAQTSPDRQASLNSGAPSRRKVSRHRLAGLLLGAALLLPAPATFAQPHPLTHPPHGATPLPVSKPSSRQLAPHRQKSAEPARREADAETTGFTVNGRRIKVDVVRAETSQFDDDGRAPAVLILHGAHGLGDGSLYYPQAKALAEHGITAFVVHYFDGIPQAHKAAPNLHDEREAIVSAAVGYVARQSFVDPDRIGIFGLSLGSFQALSLGSRDTRIQAVVDQVGAMPAEVMRRGVTRMPPTLVLHGDRDRTVPLARARELIRLLEQIGAEHEVKIYRGEGHTFRGEAREDSIARTVDFFERHLGGDRGLLKKDLDIDVAVGPALPEHEVAPVRNFTLADEKLQPRPDQAERDIAAAP